MRSRVPRSMSHPPVSSFHQRRSSRLNSRVTFSVCPGATVTLLKALSSLAGLSTAPSR